MCSGGFPTSPSVYDRRGSDPSRFSPLLITWQLVPMGEAVLYAPLPTGSWLVPPPWGGLRPDVHVLFNALIRSSLNRQLCELPAASHAAVQLFLRI
jgi:hypothetical protein